MRRFCLFLLVFCFGFIPSVRRRARTNLRIAFGPAGPRLYFKVLSRLAENILFLLKACRRTPARRPRIRFISQDVLSTIVSPPPWVCVTGHIGPFDLMNQIAGDLRTKIAVVVRPPNNRLFRMVLAFMRRRLRVEVIQKGNALRGAFNAMRAGKSVAILADHNAGFQGTFVPFLGFAASTTRLPAVLALRYRKPIVMGFIRRTEQDNELVTWIEKVIVPNPAAPPREEERRLLAEMNDAYSAVIRRHPEEWYWFHQRWKTRPGDREAGILR